jgi:hypothetical protein
MMTARGRDLEGAPRLLLPMHLGQVVISDFPAFFPYWVGWWLRRNWLSADDVGDNAGEGRARDYLQGFDKRSLRRIGGGDEDAFVTVPVQPTGGNEHTVDVTYGAVEREFAQERGASRRPPAHHRERDRDRDRKIEAAAYFPKLCRREVHRQPLTWKLQHAVADCRSNALTRLLD